MRQPTGVGFRAQAPSLRTEVSKHRMLDIRVSVPASAVLVLSGIQWLGVAAAQDAERGFYPDRQRPIVATREGATARLTGRASEFGLDLRLPGRRVRRIALAEDFSQVDAIDWISAEEVVVTGEVAHDAYVIAVIRARTGTQADLFWAREPVLSPDRRFIVFSRSYPNHGVDSVEDRVRVYDLRQSAAANRPIHSDDGVTVEVGRPLYPVLPASVEASRANVNLPEDDLYALDSTFVWSTDSSAVGFVVEHGGREPSLVVASPAASVRTASVGALCAGSCGGIDLKFEADGIRATVTGRPTATIFVRDVELRPVGSH